MHRIGLLTKVVVALVVAATLPFLLASSQLIAINADGMTEQVLSTHAVAARATADRIAARLGQLLSAAQRLAANPVLLQDPRSAPAAEVLGSFLETSPAVVGVVVLNHAGQEVVRVQRRDAAAVVDAACDQPPAHTLHVLDLAGQRWLLADQQLAGDRGRLRLLAASHWLEPLLSPEELGDGARLVIIDTAGTLVAGSDLDSFPPALRSAAETGRVAGSGRFQLGREEVLGAYHPVPGSPWVVLSRQPSVVAEQIASRMRRRAWLAIGGAGLLAGLLSIAAYRTLVRPLRNVAVAQRRLAGLGEQPSSSNEIDDLQRSFVILEQRVRDREDLGKVFLGRYQVIDLLGQGAMGSVFRGWDPRLKREVALKTIRLSASHSFRKKMAESLLHEAVTVARFHHPNIVAAYDLEDATDAAFIAMELVDGPSLQQHLQRVRSVKPDQALLIGLSVAEALVAAHGHGLVHNDIKPANILLGRDGSIKVTDFGIARFLSAVLEEPSQIYGTPGYLPPETLRGEGYDEAGDLFSLGVVLYEAVTGRPPFAGRNLQETLQNTARGVATPPGQLNHEVDKSLEGVIMKLLHPDRAERPNEAGQVVRVLRRLAEQSGATWQPPDEAPALRRVEDNQSRTQLMATTLRAGLSKG